MTALVYLSDGWVLCTCISYLHIPGGAFGYVTWPGIVRLQSGYKAVVTRQVRVTGLVLRTCGMPSLLRGIGENLQVTRKHQLEGPWSSGRSSLVETTPDGRRRRGEWREGEGGGGRGEGEEDKASSLASGLTSGLLPRSSVSSQRHSSL